jgi:enterochelin esterase family protein
MENDSFGPLVTSDQVTFRVPDPGDDVTELSLYQEVTWPRSPIPLVRRGSHFELVLARPPVDRLEYLLQFRHRDGSYGLSPDPMNQKRADGPFGEKSVVEFPQYRPPQWTAVASFPRGRTEDLEIPCPLLEGTMRVRVWSAIASAEDQPLPLLVALDGLEYDLYSSLTQLLDATVAAGDLPPFRAALLHPIRRDQDYSASPAFVEALQREVLPALGSRFAIRSDPGDLVGMGASLGGLAILHAHWSAPGVWGGLFLQSASVFNHHYFAAHLGFEHMERICSFTEEVHRADVAAAAVPVTLTCGLVEETLLANWAMAASLRRLGYPSRLIRLRDGHNWTAWRDAFVPGLVELLRSCWLRA